jgi:hypothetical protein
VRPGLAGGDADEARKLQRSEAQKRWMRRQLSSSASVDVA